MADFDNTPALPVGNHRPVYVPPPAPRPAPLRLITARLCLSFAQVLTTAAGRIGGI